MEADPISPYKRYSFSETKHHRAHTFLEINTLFWHTFLETLGDSGFIFATRRKHKKRHDIQKKGDL